MQLNELLDNTWKLLQRAAVDKKSPMRLGTVGTINNNEANLRTVVLRKVKEKQLIFYTDYRSPKVKELQQNTNISWLFYHPKKQIQLRLYGTANCLHQTRETDLIWNSLPDFAKKDYITTQSPSTDLQDNTAVPSYLSTMDASNFCVVISTIHTIDYLQLKREGHLRAKFNRDKNGGFDGKWLVP